MGTQHRLCRIPIEKSDVVMVKPSDTTPHHILSLSTIDNDPRIETLSKSLFVYKSTSHTINVVDDPASLLQHALSKALVYYYPLAGKLNRRQDNRRLQLNCTAEGVPFIRATAACTLSSLNYFDAVDFEIAYQFVPDYDSSNDETCGHHPLALQVTIFSCGGFTIGTAHSHSVCDGLGAAKCFQAMTELASGISEPSVKPVWERHRLVFSDHYCADPNPKPFILGVASVATSPYAPTDGMVREIVNVTANGIKRLKACIIKETLSPAGDGEIMKDNFTTLEILAAYVWRARFRALKLNPEGNTLFGVAVSMRRFMEPPLPDGYYGNAFVNVSFTMKGRELNDSQLSRTVKLIKEIKKSALEKQYVLDQFREIEKMVMSSAKLENGNGAFMFLSDWRQLGVLDEIDFGWKGPVNIIPLVPVNLPDICLFLPPSKLDPAMEGGVRVMVTLPRAAMAKFMEEMDALHKTDEDGSTE